MKNAGVIILAAGKGSRMGMKEKKQFLMLDGRPLFMHSLERFEEAGANKVIVVTSEDDIPYCKELLAKYGHADIEVVAGGRERYDSVYNGLQVLKADDIDIVMIHDGARPFISEDIILKSYAVTKECGATVVATPVKDTIKRVDEEGVILDTIDRSTIWGIQTPQSFRYDTILNAFEKMYEQDADENGAVSGITDDACVYERYTPYKVKVVEGSYSNIKITTREDLVIAEALLKNGY